MHEQMKKSTPHEFEQDFVLLGYVIPKENTSIILETSPMVVEMVGYFKNKLKNEGECVCCLWQNFAYNLCKAEKGTLPHL